MKPIKLPKGIINQNWEQFLKEYYCQPCSACGGHNSFWKTIIESREWQLWKEDQDNKWDFAECEELGIISTKHWEEFLKFITKTSKK